MPITLKDIAEKAAVSVSTVSRVLSNDIKKASKKTQKRVWDIVLELGYVPNINAKNLATKNFADETVDKKIIGVIYTPTYDASKDPFFSAVTIGIQLQAAKMSYKLGYCFSTMDKLQHKLEQHMNSEIVDGVIILGRFSLKFLETVCRYNDNVIYTGLNSVDFAVSEVLCDARKAIELGVEHLIQLGHSKIGYIGPHTSQYGIEVMNEHRYSAFCSVMQKQNIVQEKKYIKLTGTSVEDGFNAMCEFIKTQTLPSAIQCGCDEIAIGVLNAARVHQVKVPEQVSVIGIEDLEMVSYLQPSLSSIKVPMTEMGSSAVVLLDGMIHKNFVKPVRIEYLGELMRRNSICPLR